MEKDRGTLGIQKDLKKVRVEILYGPIILCGTESSGTRIELNSLFCV